MTKLCLTITTTLILASCSLQSSDKPEIKNEDSLKKMSVIPAKTPPETILADTMKVKAWIIAVIENYTNSQEPGLEKLKKSLTDDYYNYKQDALNLEYDNGDTT